MGNIPTSVNILAITTNVDVSTVSQNINTMDNIQILSVTIRSDQLSVKILMNVLDIFVEPFTYLISQPLFQGIFTSIFKVVKPLPKKCYMSKIENYRQISHSSKFVNQIN